MGLREDEFWRCTPRQFYVYLKHARARRQQEAMPMAVVAALMWNAWYAGQGVQRKRSPFDFMVDPPARPAPNQGGTQEGIDKKLAILQQAWGGRVTTRAQREAEAAHGADGC